MSGIPDKVMSQSHTSLSCFATCPRQYEAKYVTREIKFEQGVEAAWGDEVHKALEAYVRDGVPLPSNVQMYQKWGDAIKLRQGVKVLEGAYAIKADRTACSFFDPEAWLRAKIDVLILNEPIADIIDYKTGKQKHDVTQLRRYALLVMLKHPKVEKVRAGFAWLKDDTLSKPTIYTRDMIEQIMQIEEANYEQIEAAYMSGKFQPKPSGLCNGWCPVTRCEFWKPKRNY